MRLIKIFLASPIFMALKMPRVNGFSEITYFLDKTKTNATIALLTGKSINSCILPSF